MEYRDSLVNVGTLDQKVSRVNRDQVVAVELRGSKEIQENRESRVGFLFVRSKGEQNKLNASGGPIIGLAKKSH